MKFEKNHQYLNIALYAFLAIAASMLFYMLIINTRGLLNVLSDIATILQPIIIGLVLAYLLNPMLRFYDDKLLTKLFKGRLNRRLKRGFGILLAYITTAVFVTLFISIVLPQLIISLKSIIEQIPDFVRIVSEWYEFFLERLASMKLLNEGADANQLTYNAIEKLIHVTQSLIDNLLTQIEKLVPTVFVATTKITTGVINAIVGIIISIYLLFDREKLFAQTKKILTAIFPKKVNTVLDDIAIESHRIFSGFIVGRIIDSITVGILCFIGMTIFKMPYSVLVSVMIGVTNIIPYFGPFIGAIPGFLIIYIADPYKGLWFILFIFLLQQFDGNILEPKILGDSTGLSAFWVIFSITLFSGFFGILGMFIGVPVFALFYSLFRRFIAFLLKRKGESSNTNDYDSDMNPLPK